MNTEPTVVTALAALVEAQRRKTEKLVDMYLDDFRAAVSENWLMSRNDPDTGTPVLEWKPPLYWHNAHVSVLKRVEDESQMRAEWNGCPDCPVKLYEKQPNAKTHDDELTELVKALIDHQTGGLSQWKCVDTLVSALVSLLSSFIGKPDRKHIGKCRECLQTELGLNRPRIPQMFPIYAVPDHVTTCQVTARHRQDAPEGTGAT